MSFQAMPHSIPPQSRPPSTHLPCCLSISLSQAPPSCPSATRAPPACRTAACTRLPTPATRSPTTLPHHPSTTIPTCPRPSPHTTTMRPMSTRTRLARPLWSSDWACSSRSRLVGTQKTREAAKLHLMSQIDIKLHLSLTFRVRTYPLALAFPLCVLHPCADFFVSRCPLRFLCVPHVQQWIAASLGVAFKLMLTSSSTEVASCVREGAVICRHELHLTVKLLRYHLFLSNQSCEHLG
jgi:hypothetical protein